MGIEDELKAVRAERVIQEAARKDQETAQTNARMHAVGRLRDAFAEFREALIRHGTPAIDIIQMDSEFFRERKGIFVKSPPRRLFHAKRIGQCWVFGDILLFEDREPALHTSYSWHVGKIETFDPGKLRDYMSGSPVPKAVKTAAEAALSKAGLGESLSANHLYVGGLPFTDLDWFNDVRTNLSGSGLIELSCGGLGEGNFRNFRIQPGLGSLEVQIDEPWDRAKVFAPLKRVFASRI